MQNLQTFVLKTCNPCHYSTVNKTHNNTRQTPAGSRLRFLQPGLNTLFYKDGGIFNTTIYCWLNFMLPTEPFGNSFLPSRLIHFPFLFLYFPCFFKINSTSLHQEIFLQMSKRNTIHSLHPILCPGCLYKSEIYINS